ncbi:MAG: hypothetical protein V4710_23615 [Verrucomicrobiota bacterium]
MAPDGGAGAFLLFGAATLDDGFGICLEKNGNITRLIGESGPPFGSLVDTASSSAKGFDENGQIASAYPLTDGKRGIAVATPVQELSDITLLLGLDTDACNAIATLTD